MSIESAVLGKTGIQVSRICFGGWQASGWSSSDDNNFKETLRYAITQGINFIDTAEAYGEGHSETLVGQAIEGLRSKVVLATKFWFPQSRPTDIRRSLEGSLKRLKTDYIDLYQQHWPPANIPLEDTIAELVLLKEEGKIRAVGVSNWMEPEWQEIKDLWRIDCLQPCYNLLWRSVEKAVLPLCRTANIAVIPYSSLCQGLLTGRFSSLEQVPKDFRQKNRLFSKRYFPKVLEIVAAIKEASSELGRPMSAVALRWLLDQPGVSAPIVGASSRAQVDENLSALNWSLPAEWIEKLNLVSQPLSEGLAPHDTMWNWHPRVS